MQKINKGVVIHYESPSKCQSWTNGLYVVLKTKIKDNELHFVKILDDGSLLSFDDGRLMPSIIGLGNKGITVTKMTYKL